MKIKVCTGARCTMAGSDIIYNRIEDIVHQIDKYRNRDDVVIEDIELEHVNCLGQCKVNKKVSPVVLVDDKEFLNAQSEVIMEYIIDKVFDGNFDN